jgi:ABC-2 type transport system ATP-binding protein
VHFFAALVHNWVSAGVHRLVDCGIIWVVVPVLTAVRHGELMNNCTTGPGAVVIDATAVTKSYRTPKQGQPKSVLAGVDITVCAGEVFALLGPNGAGKTTAIEILEGFRRRDSGTVSVLGLDPAHATRHWRARLGIVGQQAIGSDEITVEEELSLQAAYFANPRPVGEVLDLVGLSGHRKQRVPKLSGGLARRLDVACGIVGRPELLFLDEPTTGFDPEARRQFWDLIGLLRDDGTTIVLTTHYLDEAEALSDNVAVLVGGKIRALGSPSELRATSSAEAKVSWTDPRGPQAVLTATPTEVVRSLLASHAGEVPNLQIIRPTLEDIYLRLVEEHTS